MPFDRVCETDILPVKEVSVCWYALRGHCLRSVKQGGTAGILSCPRILYARGQVFCLSDSMKIYSKGDF